MLSDDIKKIIEIAVCAPSPDNSQPWRFEVVENIIKVFNIPEKENDLFDLYQKLNFISIGALLENICIASSASAYNARVNMFPEGEGKNIVAQIFLKKDLKIKTDPLYPHIQERHTNRKAYIGNKIDTNIISKLYELNNQYKNVTMKLNEDDALKKDIANIASINEKMLFNNKDMHEFLFRHLTWTKKEDHVKKGFFVKSLEIKGLKFYIFKLFGNWKVLHFLNNFFPIPDIISQESAKTYAKSAGFIAIIANTLDKESFIEVGQFLQRIWLINTAGYVATQPLSGVTLMALSNMPKGSFKNEYEPMVMDGYRKLKSYFQVNSGEIVMLLRVGYASKVSARTLRLVPIIKQQ